MNAHRPAWQIILLIIALLAAPLVVRADRDIVYSARYYYPPGDTRLSHWHIYRINPDGTHKIQVTAGRTDDTNPLWSPDGKYVAFVRSLERAVSKREWICVSDPGGRTVRNIIELPFDNYKRDVYHYIDNMAWSPAGGRLAVLMTFTNGQTTQARLMLLDVASGRRHYLDNVESAAWSPDGKRLYINGSTIVDASSGRKLQRVAGLKNAYWPNNTCVRGLIRPDKELLNGYLCTVNLDGKERSRVPLVTPADYTGQGGDGSDIEVDALLPIPRHDHTIVVQVDAHNSTTGRDKIFFTLDTISGRMKELTGGQFLSFCSDGSRFITAPGRDLEDFSLSREGNPRTVWVSSLQLGTLSDGKLKTISNGKVWMDTGDWRQTREHPYSPTKKSICLRH